MQNRLTLFAALIASTALASGADAAKLTQYSLVAEGSTEPPGDKITFSVLLEPGEEAAWVLVTGHTLSEDGAVSTRISLPDEQRFSQVREASGFHRVAKHVPRAKGQPHAQILDGELVVPFESLNQPPGEWAIGYVIHLFQKTDTGWEEASGTPLPPSVFAVSKDEVARDIWPQEPASTGTLEPQVTTGFFVSNDGSVREEEVSVTQLPPEQVKGYTSADVTPVEVNVNGGYVRSPAGAEPARTYQFDPKQFRVVHFATNRNVKDAKATTAKRFGSKVAGKVTYGRCVVNIPLKTHKKGNLEKGSWWNRKNPDTAFFIRDGTVREVSREKLFESVGEKDLLLFIHGYNNSFEDAVLRTAQMHHDIEFRGEAMTFSWPSAASAKSYGSDENHAAQSIPALANLLDRLIDEHPRMHIIAHSMGNRVLLNAIKKLQDEKRISPDQASFASVTLAAPDVDMNIFGSLLPYTNRSTEVFTFYYSPQDKILRGSNVINSVQRAGLYPFFLEGMDTINADGANSVLSGGGHSYIASSDRILIDLLLMTKHSLTPSKRRPPLGPTEKLKGFVHWSFSAPKGMYDSLMRYAP